MMMSESVKRCATCDFVTGSRSFSNFQLLHTAMSLNRSWSTGSPSLLRYSHRSSTPSLNSAVPTPSSRPPSTSGWSNLALKKQSTGSTMIYPGGEETRSWTFIVSLTCLLVAATITFFTGIRMGRQRCGQAKRPCRRLDSRK